MIEWKPILTSEKKPEEGQWVFYYHCHLDRWYVGNWCPRDECFFSRFGTADDLDAPYWHPMPPSPPPIDYEYALE